MPTRLLLYILYYIRQRGCFWLLLINRHDFLTKRSQLLFFTSVLPPPCVCCLATVCKNGCHVKTILGFIHYALYSYQGSFCLRVSSSVMQRDHIRGIFKVPVMDYCINCKIRAFVFLYKQLKTFFSKVAVSALWGKPFRCSGNSSLHFLSQCAFNIGACPSDLLLLVDCFLRTGRTSGLD